LTAGHRQKHHCPTANTTEIVKGGNRAQCESAPATVMNRGSGSTLSADHGCHDLQCCSGDSCVGLTAWACQPVLRGRCSSEPLKPRTGQGSETALIAGTSGVGRAVRDRCLLVAAGSRRHPGEPRISRPQGGHLDRPLSAQSRSSRSEYHSVLVPVGSISDHSETPAIARPSRRLPVVEWENGGDIWRRYLRAIFRAIANTRERCAGPGFRGHEEGSFGSL
jgi:hypothetical protein